MAEKRPLTAKEERLAAALRANLHRRKAAARAGALGPTSEKATPDGVSPPDSTDCEPADQAV
jgi:hypothetical protein